MNTKLDQIKNSLELVPVMNWSVVALAKQYKVSVRTLERFFLKKIGQSPRNWLADQRQSHAIKLLHSGFSVKETANSLGYKHATHFSREFKQHWGRCPTTKESLFHPDVETKCRTPV